MSEVISKTIKRGTPHPSIPGLFFFGLDKRFTPPEIWVTQDRIERNKEKKRRSYASGKRYPNKFRDKVKSNLSYSKWLSKNREKANAASKSWRDRNPEAAKASQSSWNSRNRQKKLDGLKRWRQENGHRYLHYNSARRAKVTQKSIPEIDLFYKFCRRLNENHRHYKPRGMFHVDHILALSKGGKHEACNLRITTARFNLEKYNK